MTKNLSSTKNSATNPIVIKTIKDISELPKDEDERGCEVENEVHSKVDLKTTHRILKEGKRTGIEPIDIFHNFFICGKSFSLFQKCLAKL